MLDPRLTIQSEGNEDTKNPPPSTMRAQLIQVQLPIDVLNFYCYLRREYRLMSERGTHQTSAGCQMKNKKKKKSHESNWLYQLPVRNRSLFHIVVIVFNLDCL